MLAEHPERTPQLCVEFVGSVNAAFRNWVMGDPVLSSVTKFRDPVPHAELLKLYGETDMQLLILAHTALAPGNLPGKFFEYLASGNFILGIGPPDGDAAQILNATRAGEMVDRLNGEGIKTLLLRQFTQWSKGTAFAENGVHDFSRRSLTHTLSQLMSRSDI